MKILNFLFIICFIIGIIFSYYYGFKQKKTKIKEINEEKIRLYKTKEKEVVEQLELLNKKKEIIENDIKLIEENFNYLIEIEKSHEEEILENYKQKRLAEINHQCFEETIKLDKILTEKRNQHQQKIKKLQDNYNNFSINITSEIELIKKELEDWRNKRRAATEEQIRQEKILKEQDFYKVQLNQNDINDIQELIKLIPRLNNKDILSKLIFETYYKKPLSDLFSRIAGQNKPCGIYKITNTENKKIYIGKSVEIIPRRWTEHIKSSLDIGTISHAKILDAIKEYGLINFTFEILDECPKE